MSKEAKIRKWGKSWKSISEDAIMDNSEKTRGDRMVCHGCGKIVNKSELTYCSQTCKEIIAYEDSFRN